VPGVGFAEFSAHCPFSCATLVSLIQEFDPLGTLMYINSAA